MSINIKRKKEKKKKNPERNFIDISGKLVESQT